MSWISSVYIFYIQTERKWFHPALISHKTSAPLMVNRPRKSNNNPPSLLSCYASAVDCNRRQQTIYLCGYRQIDWTTSTT